jgi:hypothetical protein
MKDLMQDMKKKPTGDKVGDNRDNSEPGINTTVNVHFDPFYGKEKR